MNGWDSKTGKRALITSPWKNISKIYSWFIPFIRYDVGSGSRVLFWEDKWWGEEILASKFQRIYSISYKKGLPLSNFYSMSSSSSNLAWDLGLRRGLRDFEVEEMTSIVTLLSDVFIDPRSHDSRVWSLSPSGSFSSSFRKILVDQSIQSFFPITYSYFPFKSIWKPHGFPH